MKSLVAVALILMSLQVHAESLMKKVDLSICTPESLQCISLQAEEANGSELQKLYYMKNPVVSWKGSSTKKTYTSGYIDFDNSHLVLKEKKSESLSEETLIDMKTLGSVRRTVSG